MKTSYRPYILIAVFFFLVLSVRAQHYFSGADTEEAQVRVFNGTESAFQYPWAGGMNSCQFGEVDLNLDGILDLVAFDRMGDRLLPFVNGGTQNQVDYTYAPQFVHAFPEMSDWVLFKDYNQDGRMDIFTYARAYPGIVVYRNNSVSTLEFELEVYPFLTSLQGGGQVNILATEVDYPGIEDIDNDGDLDILVFWGLGSFVEYHQNQSMELYGIPDSLEYVEVTQCWGYFAESDESNVIYLDTCMNGGEEMQESTGFSGARHTGSTFLLLDLDADDDLDLLLGDVDYPNLVELINGGTPDSAYMVSQDPGFPSDSKPLNLFSMPVAAYIDVDNNGIRDLLVSPFDPSLVTSANYRSVWRYENLGANNQPDFNFLEQDFLQHEMIDLGSGAYPVLEDYDGDGLPDLFVSNFGYYIYSFYDASFILHSVYWSNIALYQNTGTASAPEFTRITHDFEGLHDLHLTGLYPSFGDLDGDGDKDMICGQSDGSLVYFQNTAGPGNAMEFDEPVFNYQGMDVDEFSTPQLVDLDQDGLIDLAIGEKNGNLNFYRNQGSLQSPQFVLITDSLGKVNVTDYNLSYTGFSTPCFFKNQAGQLELLVGSEQGKVFYFTDVAENLQGPFPESDSLFILIDDQEFAVDNGIRTAAAIGELNGDGQMELLVGNFAGGLNFYKGSDQPPVSGIEGNKMKLSMQLGPNPTAGYLTVSAGSDEGLLQAEVYDCFGNLHLSEVLMAGQLHTLDLSKLSAGLYILKCSAINRHGVYGSARFIKAGN